MKRITLTIICLLTCILILTTPQIVSAGVRQGIELSLFSVIPALLPFMLLTNLMMKYQLCEYISYFFKPVLSRLYPISSMGCFALIIGFTCGYPMGAKVIGDLYDKRQLSPEESCYLITFCNNCSITFLLNYILFGCLHQSLSTGLTCALVYLPPVMTGIINRFFLMPKSNQIFVTLANTDHSPSNRSFVAPASTDLSKSNHTFIAPANTDFQKSDASAPNINPIRNTIQSLSILSVYIICFTVISGWISALSFLPDFLQCLLSGMTEITSGAHFISAAHSISPANTALLILACTVFGGISIMLQSFEQLPTANLKKHYLLGKLEQLAIFILLYTILHQAGVL